MDIEVGIRGRESLQLKMALDQNGTIVSAKLTGIGGPELLRQIVTYRQLFKGSLAQIPFPEGRDAASLLMSELLLKARGEFSPPYTDEELCHCRGIPTKTVDEAILAGAHTPQKVSRQTSASTACGTCRPDVEGMIAYRLRFAK